jgi:hypothetical protein
MPSTPRNQHKPPDENDGLPANLDAERFVLGSILLYADTHLSTARAELQPGDFSLEKHQRIYRRILDLDQRAAKVDRVTVAEELKRHRELASCDGLSYLVSLDDGLPRAPHIDAYVGIVKDKAIRRRLISGADALIKRALAPTEDTETVVTAGAEFFHALQTNSNHKEDAAPAVPQWPEPLHEDAYYGVAGDVVRLIGPDSESDPAALLMQFLVGWGNMAGRGPYWQIEADRHYINENAVLVGASSRGRKGTSWGRIVAVLGAIDSHWADPEHNCQLEGVGSGEGLIDAVAGEDKRALVNEGEFARLLAVISRDGSTMSTSLRTAWDKGTLAIVTRQRKERVTGAHVSVIGHITRDELLRRLDATEVANGFGNRMLWTCVSRSKLLPHGGGKPPDLAPVIRRILEATERTRKMGNTRVRFDEQAAELWEQIYKELTERGPGMFGSITSRADPHTARLALMYALLDCATEIRIEHLQAALAVWRYCEASARFIWGDALGDSTADALLRELRAAGADGMTRWDMTNHFGRNKPAAELDRAISVLAERALIRSKKEDSGGRPTTRYWSL